MLSEIQLSDVIDEISMGPFGSDIKIDNFISSGVPVLNGSNVDQVRLREDFFKYVSEEKAKTFRKAIAKRGDIVITHRGTLGQVSYIPETSKFESYVISQSQFRISFNKKKIDPRYMVYLFHTPYGQKKLLSFKNHVGVPALAQATTNFRNLKLRVHRFSEQKKIADFLTFIDDKIELTNKINAELESLAKTIYNYWFVQFDFPISKEQAKAMGKPKLEGNPYRSSGGKMVWNEELRKEIPADWTVTQIDYYADIIDPHPSHRAPVEVANGFAFAGIGDIDEQGNVDRNKARVISEDFVVKQERDYSIGTYSLGYGRVGTVGKVVKLRKQNFRFALSPTMAVVNPKDGKFPSFVNYTVKNALFLNWVKKFTTGSTRPAIGIQELRKVPVVRPCTLSMHLISDFEKLTINTIDVADNYNKQNQELIALRDWLLPMLMNGQVRVRDAEETVEMGMVAEKAAEYWNVKD